LNGEKHKYTVTETERAKEKRMHMFWQNTFNIIGISGRPMILPPDREE